MYECESWTIKKAEHQRIDAFKLWCWKRLLRVPWTARKIKLFSPKGNQPSIFIGKTNAEAEAPIFGPPDVKSQLTGKDLVCWERLMTRREGGWYKIRWLDGITDSVDMSLKKLREIVKDRKPWHAEFMGSQRAWHDLTTEQQQLFNQRGKTRSYFRNCMVAITWWTASP